MKYLRIALATLATLTFSGVTAPAASADTQSVRAERTCPAEGTISQRWGVNGHRGLDIRNSAGTMIVAARNGTVTYSSNSTTALGYHIIVRHSDGSRTLYAHLRLRYAAVGDTVYTNQLIGEMGSTGNATASHLHFEVIIGSTQVNPQDHYPCR
ncbi:M23 family metallopeptidase [Streptomyces sp. 24-1644]|uniref:M23 family metallopeptidase n=1 Tax=Streptomyces sp. 24-1644 TaxID=3457315 RepID=UPI003FA6D0F7